jgi:hypothetical protein
MFTVHRGYEQVIGIIPISNSVSRSAFPIRFPIRFPIQRGDPEMVSLPG